MKNVYVLFIEDRMIGIYSDHRKACQTMYLDAFRSNLKMTEYEFDFGIEYFTFVDAENNPSYFSIQETELDARA